MFNSDYEAIDQYATESYRQGYVDALEWVLDNCDMTEESIDQLNEALEGSDEE